jgi:hypothetical protein
MQQSARTLCFAIASPSSNGGATTCVTSCFDVQTAHKPGYIGSWILVKSRFVGSGSIKEVVKLLCQIFFFIFMQNPKLMWVDNTKTCAAQLYNAFPSLLKVLEDPTCDVGRDSLLVC